MSDLDLLPPKQRERLDQSWAGVFRREVFARLDETPFASRYADTPSRPNIPVNVLLGLEILKVGHNWSDEDLQDAFSFDLQVRYALGYAQLGQGEFDLRTVYNFRQRLSAPRARTGQNLIERAFHPITQEQVAAFQLQTQRLRMDSTQIASNICHFSRLQLVVAILQRTYRMPSPADQALGAERFAPYLRGSAGQYVYHLKGEDSRPHLQRVGDLMQQCLIELAPLYGEHATDPLLDRVFREQFHSAGTTPAARPDDPAPSLPPQPGSQTAAAPRTTPPAPPEAPAPTGLLATSASVQVKPGSTLAASRLLSPDDPEATYRRKGSQGYRGYVTNVTETCRPENPFQLIVQVQTAPNTTSDADLLIAALPESKTRTGVQFLYNDAAFCSPAADQVLRDYQVTPIPSSLCGYAPNPARLNLADFTVARDTDGVPRQITCAPGQRATVRRGGQPHRYVGEFDPVQCAAGPLQGRGPSRSPSQTPHRRVWFSESDLALAERRQRCQVYSAGGPRLRAAVEATVGALKRPFSDDQVPVRGRFRVSMMMMGSAFMVNVRRAQRYLVKKHKAPEPSTDQPNAPETARVADSSFLFSLCRRWWRRLSTASSSLQALAFHLSSFFGRVLQGETRSDRLFGQDTPAKCSANQAGN